MVAEFVDDIAVVVVGRLVVVSVVLGTVVVEAVVGP